jgi:hypothetical protein
VTVQLMKGLAINVLYEINGSHTLGTPLGFRTDSVDVEPGLMWEPTPNLMLNPYVRLYPWNSPSLQATAMGLFVSWKLL